VRFEDIIGQEKTIEHLKKMAETNRLSHALLFTGQEGCGILPLALAFSTYLAGFFEKQETASAETDLFGEALPTKKNGEQLANDYIHPDVHYSFPVITRKAGDKPISADFLPAFREFVGQQAYANAFDWLQFIQAENKQGNITTYECADIIRKLNIKSFQSEYKILIMWLPEYLGEQGNKLLKLIEEPPPNTLFLLATHDENRLLNTIVSRCQTVQLEPLQPSQIKEALEKKHNALPAEAHRISILSEGNYHLATQLLSKENTDWLQNLFTWMTVSLKNQRVQQLGWIEEMAKAGRENQKQFLKYFLYIIQTCIKCQYLPGFAQNLPAEEQDFCQRLLKMGGAELLSELAAEVERGIMQIERNVNAKILFHALTIRLNHLLLNKSVILTK
jgi:DNA polymerase III subunit delta'